ncbi:MAG: hypothetical protein AVDCRST_MAG49-2596, partial [uncultured Thermomicrobiales bacterium]
CTTLAARSSVTAGGPVLYPPARAFRTIRTRLRGTGTGPASSRSVSWPMARLAACSSRQAPTGRQRLAPRSTRAPPKDPVLLVIHRFAGCTWRSDLGAGTPADTGQATPTARSTAPIVTRTTLANCRGRASSPDSLSPDACTECRGGSGPATSGGSTTSRRRATSYCMRGRRRSRPSSPRTRRGPRRAATG